LTLFFLAGASVASGQQSSRDMLVAEIDSIANAPIEAGHVAGMSVAVVQGNDTIVLKGYGYADLELEAPTPPRAVYEIGSVTKQFTAAAILLLQEQDKLSLDDELTKFSPEYPTQGHRITIRRLLDHTSGIKVYTEIVEFGRLRTQRLPRDSAVALFSSKPFDFAPGEGRSSDWSSDCN
jgi:CubicO group peptidase (beta-lactamase class C family)